jgi:GNAT superfamily N-acetyltransferase
VVLVREAREEEAEAIADMLCRSIRDLCAADHGGDEEMIAAWSANKTAENVCKWIAAPGIMLTALAPDGGVAGAGAAAPDGTVLLNYVAPEMRFSGVSTALLLELERWLLKSGCPEVRLESTRTALAFYLARGYEKNGPAVPWRKSTAQPLRKRLAP